MYAQKLILALATLAATAVAMPPSAPRSAPDALLRRECTFPPSPSCQVLPDCEFCCTEDPGVSECHQHGNETCANGAGVVYHCDDEH